MTAAAIRAALRPYPASAAAALLAAALAVVALAGEPGLVAAAGAFLAAVTTALAIVDARTHRLPDRLLLVGVAGAGALLLLAATTTGAWADLGRALLAALACLVGYLLLKLAHPAGLGLGDVKLGGLLGLWLGWFGWAHVLSGAFAAFLLGGFFAVVLLLTRRAGRTTAIAFGPWMILGAAVATVLAVAAPQIRA
ncbi:prepilin peptidase [Georgenia sp. SYP-B2076]|uniref:prepilin peptidase n=1 Tax=Georgenia sp. SYP-B2076 TaxID=2495881 RepID=UPI000F8F1268|nr:prepilin peptidase [Georgenia sp. SYP-B2076]